MTRDERSESKTWADLYRAHEDLRKLGKVNLRRELGDRIKALVAGGYCDPAYQGKLTDKPRNQQNHRLEVRVAGDSSPAGDPISLRGPESLLDPALYIYAVADTRARRLLQYTIRLEARWRSDDVPFTVSIELSESPEGSGACGHPLLHCHAGIDHQRTPQFRLPLPPLKPWEALDWLLVQLDKDFEKHPWTGVLAGAK
jgi:hypothetical protein